MPTTIEPCVWCGRDFYPNELALSAHMGGLVCADCRADQGPTHGEIQAAKRDEARGAAWNHGKGYEVKPWRS